MKFFLVIIFLILKISHSNAHSAPAFDGYRCEGPEKTVARHNGVWNEYFCIEGEWFLKIDGEQPITVKFIKSLSAVNYDFYTVVPTIPVSAKARWILRRYWARVDRYDVMEFVAKR